MIVPGSYNEYGVNFRVFYDPATALIIMGIGALVGAIGNAVEGAQEQHIANEQAAQEEKTANKQYGLAKTEATAQLEELRIEEKKAKSGLIQGAAHAGIKIDAIHDVKRTDTATLISDMEKDKAYSKGVSGTPGSTLEALSNEISRQITNSEKGVMRNLSNAKLGLDNALFDASILREKGQMAATASYFNAGSTLLTGASNIYGAGKDWGVW